MLSWWGDCSWGIYGACGGVAAIARHLKKINIWIYINYKIIRIFTLTFVNPGFVCEACCAYTPYVPQTKN